MKVRDAKKSKSMYCNTLARLENACKTAAQLLLILFLGAGGGGSMLSLLLILQILPSLDSSFVFFNSVCDVLQLTETT